MMTTPPTSLSMVGVPYIQGTKFITLRTHGTIVPLKDAITVTSFRRV
jgi:hypothetical protein